MEFSFKNFLPHFLIVLGFILASLLYFSPVLKGKQISQSDIKQYIGMAKQQNDFRTETGEETYWTNSGFGGMPTYQLGAKYPHNYIKKLDLTLRFLPRPADYLFLYFIGFYILLLVLRVDYKLAGLGALAFGFSTYLIIILGVGHNAKAHAIAYMPLVLAGIILTFQKKYISGFLLTTIALALEIVANHFQMTYYLLLLVLVLGVAYLIDAYKKKQLSNFFISVGILSVAATLAVGLNATNIMATQEYAKESTRSKSELTINPDGSFKEVSSGLSKDYITEYSYGKLETFNLFIPRFMGGGNTEDLGRNSNTYDAYRKLGAQPKQALDLSKNAPMYWGDQPIVEAPAYIGAVILFLFVFALFLVKGRLKWWLVGGVVLSLLLSYGKNLSFLTNFFIDYIPLYNKFRAVSSIQVILELCIPILGIFGLVKLFNDFEKEETKIKALKYATAITGGIAFLFLLLKGSLFDFVSFRDGGLIQAYGPDFIESIKADRKAIFTSDTIRTLILVLLSASLIWYFLKKKLSQTLVISGFALLILFDLIAVDRRYVNTDNFVSGSQVQNPYLPNVADQEILKDNSHFRVFDLSSGDTRASYFHNSLSGYHAAKMKRYDELYNFHLVNNNIQVLSMLNTKYIIVPGQGESNEPQMFENTDANGNAWFVENIKWVDTADEEIRTLDSLNTAITAVIMKSQLKAEHEIEAKPQDSLASILLTDYKPNHLTYTSNTKNGGFAVFSENYYKHGWQAYIDGSPTDHIRVDYVLRGMQIPSGNHTIEFKFEPSVIKKGSRIALGSSVIVGILFIIGLFLQFRNTKKDKKSA
ncbi:hypothetical protein D7030_02055 [Flavobacteriaceae bacterium AU392]|nr:hypothetical protein D1817_08530 [Flavobacteriaceae bacterium]RKM85480.1 hypothetical protein D7030_02055 [Flavobacteriaceae bacterium AU392]